MTRASRGDGVGLGRRRPRHTVQAQAALGDGRAASAAHPERRPPSRRSSSSPTPPPGPAGGSYICVALASSYGALPPSATPSHLPRLHRRCPASIRAALATPSPVTVAAVMAHPAPALLSAALPFAHISRAFDAATALSGLFLLFKRRPCDRWRFTPPRPPIHAGVPPPPECPSLTIGVPQQLLAAQHSGTERIGLDSRAKRRGRLSSC